MAEFEPFRTQKKQPDGSWLSTHFSWLRQGDIFKLFKMDGTPMHEGQEITAKGDAIQDAQGVWCVPVKDPKHKTKEA